MSNNPSNTVTEVPDLENLSLKDSTDLESEKQKNTASETKPEAVVDTELTIKPVTNDKVVEGDLEKFAERLEINKFTENKNEWKKFYDFAGSGFDWPSTNINERRLIFDYVVDPDWDPIGEELALNAIKYCQLLKSNTLDQSCEYVLIVNGKFVRYGTSDEEEDLVKKYPGCYFVPVKKRVVELRKFSAINNETIKEWQVHFRLRNTVNALDEVGMANIEQGFRNVIDTGATMTVIPYFVREKLYSRQEGWKNFPIEASGYGEGIKIFQASRDWYICLGDGINWSCWFKTNEIYSWQKNPNDIRCSLIGYDVLNNIPHYKPCRQPYIFLKNDIIDQVQKSE
ncbi:hypothetical protein C1646_770225 [Rhizophagus diaphanus]|nr:hypothetical protein C1646_770225 [Rhizophagus diaphanus] [Rhizophagus sp. MUCL 43196]